MSAEGWFSHKLGLPLDGPHIVEHRQRRGKEAEAQAGVETEAGAEMGQDAPLGVVWMACRDRRHCYRFGGILGPQNLHHGMKWVFMMSVFLCRVTLNSSPEQTSISPYRGNLIIPRSQSSVCR